MRAVDTYFVWSSVFVDRARKMGARHALYQPFACDPVLHNTDGAHPQGAPVDVAFVGNWDAERERMLSPCADAGLGLAVHGGENWRDRCRHEGLRAAWRGSALVGRDMVGAVRATKVNINVLRRQNKGACNMRTFEIPWCGGFMLHERSHDLPALFRPGVECDDFATPQELVEKSRFYVERDALRDTIAARGRDAAARHTYAHWAWRILDGLALAGRVTTPPGARRLSPAG